VNRRAVVAGIGIVGALLGPVLVDAGRSTSSLAFMVIALLSAIGVLVWRRWSSLAVVSYVVSAPQAADWLDHERHAHLGLALVVTGAFWALYLVAALGYELRVPTTTLRLASASLLFVNAAATAAGGWAMLDDAGTEYGATAWVLALAAAHVLLGVVTLRGRISREIGALIAAVGAALAAVGMALALEMGQSAWNERHAGGARNRLEAQPLAATRLSEPRRQAILRFAEDADAPRVCRLPSREAEHRACEREQHQRRIK